jgi:regulator of protease activity HflC (stomatin/prohibitin superfamily)
MENPLLKSFLSNPVKYILGIVGTVVVLNFLGNSFAIVNPGERGLLINLGKLQDQVLDEGIHPIMPFVTSVKLVNVRIQQTTAESTARTKDLQQINTITSLNWKIEPAKVKQVFQEIGSQEDLVTKLITPIFEETIKSSVPTRTLETVLVQRDILANEVKTKIANRLAVYGIAVTDVAFVNLTTSEEFTKSTEARQVAEQEVRKAEFEVQKAKKTAEALVNKARGEAEAQRILERGLSPQILQKQAIEKWDGKLPTVMGGNQAVPFINISELSKKP